MIPLRVLLVINGTDFGGTEVTLEPLARPPPPRRRSAEPQAGGAGRRAARRRRDPRLVARHARVSRDARAAAVEPAPGALACGARHRRRPLLPAAREHHVPSRQPSRPP